MFKSIKQLRAIKYQELKIMRKKQRKVLQKYGLENDFEQSKYKYMTNYLKAMFKRGIIKDWKDVYGG